VLFKLERLDYIKTSEGRETLKPIAAGLKRDTHIAPHTNPIFNGQRGGYELLIRPIGRIRYKHEPDGIRGTEGDGGVPGDKENISFAGGDLSAVYEDLEGAFDDGVHGRTGHRYGESHHMST